MALLNLEVNEMSVDTMQELLVDELKTFTPQKSRSFGLYPSWPSQPAHQSYNKRSLTISKKLKSK
jgi:hypothetical protein